MAKQERTRKSAPHNRVKSFQDAQIPINPSSGLSEAEKECFDAIIASRERSTWLPADIRMATHLAIVEVQRDFAFRTYLDDIEEGLDRMPHSFRVYTQLGGQINTMRRDLGLTASQRGISGEKQAKRNQQDAKAVVSPMNSLIARPDVAS
jgi:hypothetical protein